MRDRTSGYVIAALFVCFLAIAAAQGRAIRVLIEDNERLAQRNEVSVTMIDTLTELRAADATAARVEVELTKATCVPPTKPGPKRVAERRVPVPTFGGGSTVRF